MKPPFVCVILLSALVFGNAQAQKSDSSYFDIGVNTIRILNWDAGNVSPYAIHAEYGFGRVSLRVGAGMYSQSVTELPNTFNGNSEFTSDTSSMNLRFGLAVRSAIGSRWSLKYGADFLTGRNAMSFNTVIEDVDGNLIENTTERNWSYSGVGIFLFPQYHISPRISVATEFHFAILGTKESEEVTSTNFPDFDSLTDREGNSSAFIFPSALYLIARF